MNKSDIERIMNYVNASENGTKDCFNEIVNLSEQKRSTFKARGDFKNFVIESDANNFVILLSILITLGVPVFLLYADTIDKIFFWILEVALVLVLIIFLSVYMSTNIIEIDTNSKTIKIRSNNFVGKYIIPKEEIAFKEFKKFTTKTRTIQGKTMTTSFNRIYIGYGKKKKHLIDLPDGPHCFINHHSFMNCLEKIIRGNNL